MHEDRKAWEGGAEAAPAAAALPFAPFDSSGSADLHQRGSKYRSRSGNLCAYFAWRVDAVASVVSEPVSGVVPGLRSSSRWAVRALTPDVQRHGLEACAVVGILQGFAQIIGASSGSDVSNPAAITVMGVVSVAIGLAFTGLRRFGLSFVAQHLSALVWLTFPIATTMISLSLSFAGPDYAFVAFTSCLRRGVSVLPISARFGAIALLSLVAIEYAAVLALVDGFTSPVLQWASVMLTLSVVGVLASGFTDRADRLAVSEYQARQQLACVNETLEERVREQVADIERLSRLRRFLSPQIADVVMSRGADQALAPHRRDIAVLFCDLRNFTRFSHQTEPEEVLEVINDYYDVVGRILRKHDGTVGHFAGDGIMAYFNDPVPCEAPRSLPSTWPSAYETRCAGFWRDGTTSDTTLATESASHTGTPPSASSGSTAVTTTRRSELWPTSERACAPKRHQNRS